VLELEDWRTARIERITFGDFGTFDPVLGWVLEEDYESDDYSTFDLGLRRNFGEEEIRTGGILAVGDAFTGGLDVADHETWPAQLERIGVVSVLNAGVAGYASDQIVLRAEQLLPQVRPRTVVVGLIEGAIARAGLSSFGPSKPFFTLEDGRLTYHPPLMAVDPVTGWPAKVRDVLGYSAVLDVVLSLLAPDHWLGGARQGADQYVGNDPVAVTCALLQRLEKRAEEDGIRVILFMQHALQTIAGKTEPGGDLQKVAACAGTLGLEIVDLFAELRTVAAAGPDALARLYLQRHGDEEMSTEGNRRAAELLTRALGKNK
jgi:hypothetical protein